MNQSLIWSIAYIVALFAIFYFLFIRPQKKKDKELKEMRELSCCWRYCSNYRWYSC